MLANTLWMSVSGLNFLLLICFSFSISNLPEEEMAVKGLLILLGRAIEIFMVISGSRVLSIHERHGMTDYRNKNLWKHILTIIQHWYEPPFSHLHL